VNCIDRNRNRSFNLIQNKVGYRSCFATGVKLEQFLLYFHETIDFSLTSVTSSHVQIWKTVTKIVVGVKVL
jgi:hypothetical protein